MHFIILLLFVFFKRGLSESTDILLGAILEENSENERAFKFAIDSINAHRDSGTMLSPIIKNLNPSDPFRALSSACSILDEHVVAIFGPKSPEDINIVQSLCDYKEIPHVITQLEHKPLSHETLINLYPHGPTLSRCYLDIIQTWQWKTFTLFYEDNESLFRMANLIQTAKQERIVVTVKQLDSDLTGIYRTSLREARDSGEENFVIDCRIDHLEEVLLQAQQIGLMTRYYNFIITNLDMHTINLAPFQYCEANITGIRIINPDSDSIIQVRDALYLEEEEAPYTIKSETALLIDAVSVFTNTLEDIPKFYNYALADVSCNTSKSFIFGTTLINYAKGKEYLGLTGVTKFDNEGQRSYFTLDVTTVKENGIFKVGTWNASMGFIPSDYRDENDDPDSLRNLTFIVITCLTDPYGILKDTSVPLQGNDRFEGFGIDLIHELSLVEGFNYTFIIRHDKKNGAKDANGKWTGMIGDLIDYRADLAITDLTITSERQDAVDFTPPFMNLGISILFQKPGKAPPSFFSFADPFALDTWTMLALAYVVVSLSLFVIGRFSPDEWTNPYPCIEEPEYLVNQFSLQNSAWFTIGSLMQQGTEIAPIGIATRMVAGMWWFFVLLMVSSYTANLAAFLTTENPIELFTDINSLVENSELHKIRYGAKANGATAAFFKESKLPVYQKVYEHMENHPEDMVKENRDGVELAEKKTYAFFMESTSIEYEIQRHCNLQQYGGLLDDKGYGIAMRKNSPYRKRLSTAVLKLQASGMIDTLKRKWWEEKKGGGQCAGESEAQAATPLNLKNVEGVFYVTISGMVCSVFCVMVEMVLHAIKSSVKTRLPLKDVLKNELKAYFNFNSNVKQVLKANSESDSKSTSKSESKSESGNDSKKANGLLKPEPYGFILEVTKE